MNQLAVWIASVTGLTTETSLNLANTAAILLVLWAARPLVLRIVWRRTDDARTRYEWRRISGYVAATLGVLLVGRIWFKGFQSLAVYAGLFSAGIAIALKDLVANAAAWVFIVSRRPFAVGDRIQIGEFSGDVIDIRFFQFSLMEVGNWVEADQSTGRVLHIPNGMLLSAPLANYSHGFRYIWNEIPVLVTFESNWRKAKEILQEVATAHDDQKSKRAERTVKEASKRFMISYSTLTPIVYTTVRDSGVLLTIRYLCLPRQRRGTEEAMWEDVLDRFATAPDIDFAYPTRRFYDGPTRNSEA
jgi:small-conductance mechanosensitive channel